MNDPADFSDVPRNSSVNYSITKTMDRRGNIVQDDYVVSHVNAKRDYGFDKNYQRKTKMDPSSVIIKKPKTYAGRHSEIIGNGRQDSGLDKNIQRKPKDNVVSSFFGKKPKMNAAEQSATEFEAKDKRDSGLGDDTQQKPKKDNVPPINKTQAKYDADSSVAGTNSGYNTQGEYFPINERSNGLVGNWYKMLNGTGSSHGYPEQNSGWKKDSKGRVILDDPTDFSNVPKNSTVTVSVIKIGDGSTRIISSKT